MDKIEVFIRNVLSAWTLLLFIQKAASTLFTKSKVKETPHKQSNFYLAAVAKQ